MLIQTSLRHIVTLAITLKELGQLEAAIKSYEKALSVNPDFAEAHTNLGNAFNELGQPDDAVKFYEKASLLTQTTLRRIITSLVWPIITSVLLSWSTGKWMLRFSVMRRH